MVNILTIHNVVGLMGFDVSHANPIRSRWGWGRKMRYVEVDSNKISQRMDTTVKYILILLIYFDPHRMNRGVRRSIHIKSR
jgi:hypothetical protein